jgi:hypothetical protein
MAAHVEDVGAAEAKAESVHEYAPLENTGLNSGDNAALALRTSNIEEAVQQSLQSYENHEEENSPLPVTESATMKHSLEHWANDTSVDVTSVDGVQEVAEQGAGGGVVDG